MNFKKKLFFLLVLATVFIACEKEGVISDVNPTSKIELRSDPDTYALLYAGATQFTLGQFNDLNYASEVIKDYGWPVWSESKDFVSPSKAHIILTPVRFDSGPINHVLITAKSESGMWTFTKISSQNMVKFGSNFAGVVDYIEGNTPTKPSIDFVPTGGGTTEHIIIQVTHNGHTSVDIFEGGGGACLYCEDGGGGGAGSGGETSSGGGGGSGSGSASGGGSGTGLSYTEIVNLNNHLENIFRIFTNLENSGFNVTDGQYVAAVFSSYDLISDLYDFMHTDIPFEGPKRYPFVISFLDALEAGEYAEFIDGVPYYGDSDKVIHFYLEPINVATATDQEKTDQILTALVLAQKEFCRNGGLYEAIDWSDYMYNYNFSGVSVNNFLWQADVVGNDIFDVTIDLSFHWQDNTIMEYDPANRADGTSRYIWTYKHANSEPWVPMMTISTAHADGGTNYVNDNHISIECP